MSRDRAMIDAMEGLNVSVSCTCFYNRASVTMGHCYAFSCSSLFSFLLSLSHTHKLTCAQNVVSFDEFGDPIALSGAERTFETDAAFASATSATKPARTWAGWVQYKVTAPFESTLTAVGVSYWIASMLSAGINSRVRV